MSAAPSSPCSGDQASELPIEGEIEKGKKKKKAIAKILCKAHPGKPSDDRGELGEDPFNDPGIVRDLTNKFTMLEVVYRMADLDPQQLIWGSLWTILKSSHKMLALIKRARCQEVEA
ncbi:putative ensconsin-like [Cocos nucifera]|nr:putative ensconsin-like [Cocos nucifera]